MRTGETLEQRQAFEEAVNKWMDIEDNAITECDQVNSSTDNILVRGLADAIKADAVKHRELLGVISEALQGTITLTPDELGMMSKLLDSYVQMEKQPIKLAGEEKTAGANLIVRELLAYILEDDKKYDRFRDQFNELKIKIYPYA